MISFNDFIIHIQRQANDIASKKEPLIEVVENNTSSDGLFLEFGVYKGHTINNVAERKPFWKIYGFDSFEGLPEKWRPKFNKGAFSLHGNLPQVKPNVALVKGWFESSIPQWKSDNPGLDHIDILHIDCDLYSSTKTVFDNLKHMIDQNTTIVFDELINYPTFENHEIKALYEFLEEKQYGAKVIYAGGYNNEKVAISLYE